MTTTTTLHPLAVDYLDRLERAARRLPRGERRELVDEIRAHVSEAIDPDASDAEALTVLDRLGDPEDIVDAELPPTDVRADRPGVHEWWAIFLLPLGGFIFGIGWIAGAVLLWSSPRWNLRDKLIGTFVVPGGLAAGLWVAAATLIVSGQTCSRSGGPGNPVHCTGGPSTLANIGTALLLIYFFIGPFFTAVYLALRARPRGR